MHRELLEETGRRGTVLAWNTSYYDEGWVALMRLDRSEEQIDDVHVAETRWWDSIPPMDAWNPGEFSDLGEWVKRVHRELGHAL